MDRMTSGTSHYGGTYDPLATFRRLRDAGVLGDYAYLHMSPRGAEIGWAPLERLALLDGHRTEGWRAQLQALAARAYAVERKAFGYVGFDAVDRTVGTLPDGSDSGWPLAEFIIPGELATFAGDQVVHHTHGGVDLSEFLAVRQNAPPPSPAVPSLRPIAEVPDDEYTAAVHHATVALRRGEAQKVVLSRYQVYDLDYDPVDLFATYCLSQLFVDAFLVCFGDLAAMIASPEALLVVADGALETNPLAGTRPRGATVEDDARLRAELRADHKEIAEHVLSVTTMLEELAPLCVPESLTVSRLLDICLQQRVQHLSSTLRARLTPERHALDAFWALFPSVTVTGLPKPAALDLVRRLEPHPRALYAGAFGWMAGGADCRFSLAIRGIFRYGDRTFLHAGAGIMPESRPAAELAETGYKLQAMQAALAQTVGLPTCPRPALR
jgi:salicylate synthetase